MAHESFEDEAVSKFMNQHFINIKVDREERPDIDRIYMDALHLMGEQGGWPLTIFLTPDLKPFWGGTYFPPDSRYGRPSFTHVLNELFRIWSTEREKVNTNTQAILERMKAPVSPKTEMQPNSELLQQTIQQLVNAADKENGGIGRAPKFPQSPLFSLMWSAHQSYPNKGFDAPVWLTMNKISQGGIYDHLAGGIARYAVDERWLVPHFEKMLYDNAQYVSLLCVLQNSRPNNLFRLRIEETINWLLTSMRTGDGLFASSYDADSEGVEGKYYCWSKAEIDSALNESTRHLFSEIYDVTETGNWENTNILNRTDHPEDLPSELDASLAKARAILLETRTARIPPDWDDKALTDWNALTVIALLDASATLDNAELRVVALKTLQSLLTLLRHDGRLHHSYRAGAVRSHATADDFAHLISANISAYEATFDTKWLNNADKLTSELIDRYQDHEAGGFYMAPQDASDLILRDKYANDDVTPNANATMVINLWKLSVYLDNPEFLSQAEKVFEWLVPHMINNPFSCPTAWQAFLALKEQPQIVLSGQQTDRNFIALHQASRKVSIPNRLLMHVSAGTNLPIDHPAAGKQTASGNPTAFICRNQTCSMPITDPALLAESSIH
jgi:uncharacterized protein YyaL (SSP411 family)